MSCQFQKPQKAHVSKPSIVLKDTLKCNAFFNTTFVQISFHFIWFLVCLFFPICFQAYGYALKFQMAELTMFW